jgi:hypothetical protein
VVRTDKAVPSLVSKGNFLDILAEFKGRLVWPWTDRASILTILKHFFIPNQEIKSLIACVQRERVQPLYFAGNNHRFTVFRPKGTAERSPFPTGSAMTCLIHRLLFAQSAALFILIARASS